MAIETQKHVHFDAKPNSYTTVPPVLPPKTSAVGGAHTCVKQKPQRVFDAEPLNTVNKSRIAVTTLLILTNLLQVSSTQWICT